jgi:hypothetical protein
MAATEILEREVVFHRYYDPATGQFISSDPLVDVTGQPYAYAGDDPVNASDPNGLAKQLTFAELAKMARSIPTQCGSARDAALNKYWSAYSTYWAVQRVNESTSLGSQGIHALAGGVTWGVFFATTFVAIAAPEFIPFEATPLGTALVGGVGFALGAVAGVRSNTNVDPPSQLGLGA